MTKVLHFSKQIIKFNKAFYYYRQGRENNQSRKVKIQNFYDLDFVFNDLRDFLILHYPNNIKFQELLLQKRAIHLNYLWGLYKPQPYNPKYLEVIEMFKHDIKMCKSFILAFKD